MSDKVAMVKHLTFIGMLSQKINIQCISNLLIISDVTYCFAFFYIIDFLNLSNITFYRAFENSQMFLESSK